MVSSSSKSGLPLWFFFKSKERVYAFLRERTRLCIFPGILPPLSKMKSHFYFANRESSCNQPLGWSKLNSRVSLGSGKACFPTNQAVGAYRAQTSGARWRNLLITQEPVFINLARFTSPQTHSFIHRGLISPWFSPSCPNTSVCKACGLHTWTS